MIDPLGRFYSNCSGRYLYGRPILDVGVKASLADVGCDAEKFVRRGGMYEWAHKTESQPSGHRRLPVIGPLHRFSGNAGS
jgi:hypothetical protein